MNLLIYTASLMALCCAVNALSANVEVAIYVVDDLAEAIYNKWGWTGSADKEDRLKSLLLAQYDTGLNSVYGDSSLTNRGINIKVAIAEIRIVANKDIESYSSLYDLCKWQNDKTGGRDAALFIGLKNGPFHNRMGFSAGRGFTDTACRGEVHCAMVADNPSLDSANSRLAAHELGHVLGLIDQGYQLQRKLQRSPQIKGKGPYADERCATSDTKAVMAGNAYSWCICSQDALLKNLPKFTCLTNEPEVKLTADTSKLPGAEHSDRRKQCEVFKMESTDPSTYSIEYREKDVSASPCKFVSGECIKKEPTPQYPWRWRDFGDAPLLAGTPCGNGKMCLNGECVDGGSSSAGGSTGGSSPNGPAGGAPSASTCPDGWKQFEGSCYASLSNNRAKISKQNAQAACQTQGGNLASIPSQAVNDFLVSNFNTRSKSAWIGLERVNGNWRWMDGTPYTWTGWARNNPRSNQDCASIGSSSKPSSWFSKDCNRSSHQRRYYICSLKLAKK